MLGFVLSLVCLMSPFLPFWNGNIYILYLCIFEVCDLPFILQGITAKRLDWVVSEETLDFQIVLRL